MAVASVARRSTETLDVFTMRIHITGNAGAGKTTLARELGKRLGSPSTHLDRFVWQPGWKEVPQEKREQLLQQISDPESWLIEGVSSVVRHRADIVVFLDVPRYVCLWRCMKRNWRYLFRSRPELPDNCPEYRILPRLLRLIWRFPSLVGARIHDEARKSSKYVVIRGLSEAEVWLNEFTSKAPPDSRL